MIHLLNAFIKTQHYHTDVNDDSYAFEDHCLKCLRKGPKMAYKEVKMNLSFLHLR